MVLIHDGPRFVMLWRLTEGSSVFKLPEMSNFGCLPGGAGGSPFWTLVLCSPSLPQDRHRDHLTRHRPGAWQPPNALAVEERRADGAPNASRDAFELDGAEVLVTLSAALVWFAWPLSHVWFYL
jgi:hypothetical protein